jgi:ATP phosphoribosyltransferase
VLHWRVGDGEYFALRPKAIPALVAHGVLDVGYCGSDSLDEFLMPEMFDVKRIAPQRGVRMVVAAAQPDVLQTPLDRPLLVGTSYPVTAARYLARLGKAHVIVEQPGCTEGLCPSLVDLVIDVTETGETLSANGLIVLEELGALWTVEIKRKA